MAAPGQGATLLSEIEAANPATSVVTVGKKFVKQQEEDGDEHEWISYLEPAKLEVLDHLEPWAEANMLPLLKPVDAAWQPTDMLPDPAVLGADGFHSACDELRAPGVPGGEHGHRGGAADVPERVQPPRGRERPHRLQRHRLGDVLNKYLFLSGRVDMRRVELTVHRLIHAGMAMRAARSPYHGFVYAAFQERATSVSHGNMARHAKEHGDAALGRICGAIAADEKRHEAAYTRVVGKLFEVDPDGAVRALAYMMRRRITRPASLMTDGGDGDLFAHYAAVAQHTGMYTASDYRQILEHLIKQWRVEELAAGLSGEGRRARDNVFALPQKMRRLEDKARPLAKKPPASVPFSWIFDRPVKFIKV